MKDRNRLFSDEGSLWRGLPIVAFLLALCFAILMGIFCSADAFFTDQQFNWQLFGRGTLIATAATLLLLLMSDIGQLLISFFGISLTRGNQLAESGDIETEKWF